MPRYKLNTIGQEHLVTVTTMRLIVRLDGNTSGVSISAPLDNPKAIQQVCRLLHNLGEDSTQRIREDCIASINVRIRNILEGKAEKIPYVEPTE